MISTKGRYTLRMLIDIAQQDPSKHVPLKDVAERQGISEKYLQQMAKVLVDNGLLVGVSGRGGGYRLTKDPAEYNVFDVLELMEGGLASVACLACGSEACPQAETCKTLPMWEAHDKMVREFFSGITIADLARGVKF